MTKAVKTSHNLAKKKRKDTAMPQKTVSFTLAGDDALVPFAVESLSARGRAVQLGPALDTLVKRHNYPEPVAALLAETVVLTVLLGSSLKFQGKFIMQAQTDGAVNMIICNYVTPAEASVPASIRAYARFDEIKLEHIMAKKPVRQADLLGKGTLALTLDQGAHMQLYQGIVALESTTLEEAAHQYFAQSEQIPTKIRLATALLSTRNAAGALHIERRGGGVLVQYLPQSRRKMRESTEKQAEEETAHGLAGGAREQETHLQSAQDQWRETEMLAATIEDAELTDPQLPVEQLLYRLFHSQGVRVFPPQKLVEKCSCSREKLFQILSGFSEKERKKSVKNGKIRAKCEFCSAVYEFSSDEFAESGSISEAK